MLDNGFSERIRKVRGNRSKTEVSRLSGISRHSWSNYENGIKEPSFEVLHDICKGCNVSADYLLGLRNDD